MKNAFILIVVVMLCIDLVGRYREKETDVLALWITGGVIVLGVIALFSVEVV